MNKETGTRIVNYADKDVVYSVLPHVTISAHHYNDHAILQVGKKKYFIPKEDFLSACQHFVQNHKTTKPNERD